MSLKTLLKIPNKCCLVEIIYKFTWGKYIINVGDLGIFLDHTRTDVSNKEYEAIIVDHFQVYFPHIGKKIHVARSNFKVVEKK